VPAAASPHAPASSGAFGSHQHPHGGVFNQSSHWNCTGVGQSVGARGADGMHAHPWADITPRACARAPHASSCGAAHAEGARGSSGVPTQGPTFSHPGPLTTKPFAKSDESDAHSASIERPPSSPDSPPPESGPDGDLPGDALVVTALPPHPAPIAAPITTMQ
jgi:hypothetical protein